MSILWCDFETRSRCDLKARGVYNYMLDGSTEVLCMSYAIDDEDVRTWRPGEPFPPRVAQHTGAIYAHNAAFERLAFKYLLADEVDFKLAQFVCTATQARANCAPGSLEDLGRFVGADMRKDYRGALLVRQLCIPNDRGFFNNDPLLMAELVCYCEQDVRAMRDASKAMRKLSEQELVDYRTNERINDRGVEVDTALARAAIKYEAAERGEIEEDFARLTKGEIKSVRSPKMSAWVYERLPDDVRNLMHVYKDGVKRISLDKSVRANLLAFSEENPGAIDDDTLQVIQCADDLWASSVAKFQRALSLADDEDSRVRGAFVFAGGAATGRASSYGLQVHNLPRKAHKTAEKVRAALIGGGSVVPEFGKRCTDVLKGMLRPTFVAGRGNVLVRADWSAIEARVTPWASGRDGERKLDLFRSGVDIYKVNASGTFSRPVETVTDEQRQVGKVQELALGFAGGVGAFASMGRAYGIVVPEDTARGYVNAWRNANPWAVQYWETLERGYTHAMRAVHKEVTAGVVTYYWDTQHLWYMLPSGRVLCYPFARFEPDGSVSYAKCSWKPKADAKEWPRGRLWKGLACENITQAIANDLLRHALRELDAGGVRVVLHVHDEIVVECDATRAEETTAMLRQVMTTPPKWCNMLPLSIGEPIIATRYGK